MKRWLLHILAALSLLVCVALLRQWPFDHLQFRGGPGPYSMDPAAKSHPVNFLYLFLERIHDNSKPDRPVVYWILIIPSWWFVPVAIVPLAWWLVWQARGLRRVLAGRGHGARGLCARCGYDLRATPARCPECGARVAGSGAATPGRGLQNAVRPHAGSSPACRSADTT